MNGMLAMRMVTLSLGTICISAISVISGIGWLAWLLIVLVFLICANTMFRVGQISNQPYAIDYVLGKLPPPLTVDQSEDTTP